MTRPSPSGRFARRLATPLGSASRPGGGFHSIRKAAHDLWPKADHGIGALQRILKTANDSAPSRVADEVGEVRLPFDFEAATTFKLHNVHHSTCVEARKQAMVGLGNVVASGEDQSRAAVVLDPKCRVSWQTVLTEAAEDYVNVGNAYLEVVRRNGNPNGPIVGVHYIPASQVTLVLEDARGIDRHFKVSAGNERGGDLVMAQFGDLGDFQRRVRDGRTPTAQVASLDGRDASGISELIHIPQPSTGLDRWYGFPDWLAATGYVELTQAVLQAQFDLFTNRGVPEFLLFLLGGQVDAETWKAMTNTFDGYVGFGNGHKSSLFNLPDQDLKVQVERLALEGIANGTFFKDMMEVLSTTIVSAHRVPPPIAGILIPGKMGAANEATNAIMAFQTLVIGPAQHHFQTVLGCTLGNSAANGGLGLSFRDFKFNTIVDAMQGAMQQLAPADTMGRMRDELPQAAARGRNLNDGLLRDGRDDGDDGDDSEEDVQRSRVQQLLKDEGLMASLFAAAAEAQAKRNGNGRT